MLDGEHIGQDQRAGSQQPGNGGRNQAGRQQEDHAKKDHHGLRGPRAHRHGLTAHQLRRIDDEHIRIGQAHIQRLPGALQQQRIAGLQFDLAVAEVGAGPLDGDHQKVAALRDHAGEHRGSHQRRAGRDHDLGEARVLVEQDLLGLVVVAETQMVLAGEGRGFLGAAAQEQHVARLEGLALQR